MATVSRILYTSLLALAIALGAGRASAGDRSKPAAYKPQYERSPTKIQVGKARVVRLDNVQSGHDGATFVIDSGRRKTLTVAAPVGLDVLRDGERVTPTRTSSHTQAFRLYGGTYETTDGRIFDVKDARPRAERRSSRWERLRLETIVFAKRPNGPEEKAFDENLVAGLRALGTRGVPVSIETGRDIGGLTWNINRLERKVTEGELRRVVSKREDGTLVAAYVGDHGTQPAFEIELGMTSKLAASIKGFSVELITRTAEYSGTRKTLEFGTSEDGERFVWVGDSNLYTSDWTTGTLETRRGHGPIVGSKWTWNTRDGEWQETDGYKVNQATGKATRE